MDAEGWLSKKIRANVEQRDPLADLLLRQDAARDTHALQHDWAAKLRQERDDAEQAVRDSLARIRAVVEAGKAVDDYDGQHGEVSGEVLDDFRSAFFALTADDRRLLGMDQ